MPLVEDPDGGGHIRNTANIWRGRIAWLSAPVQKIGGPQGPVGSNPTPSANVPLAQLEKACGYEPQDREFESLKGCHVAVVQLEERLIVAQKVADSNSASHPIFIQGFRIVAIAAVSKTAGLQPTQVRVLQPLR